jgi:hypothetical protein
MVKRSVKRCVVGNDETLIGDPRRSPSEHLRELDRITSRRRVAKKERQTSLSSEEWKELWDVAKRLEQMYNDSWCIRPHSGYRRRFREDIKLLKAKIQSVVGQLETDPRAL